MASPAPDMELCVYRYFGFVSAEGKEVGVLEPTVGTKTEASFSRNNTEARDLQAGSWQRSHEVNHPGMHELKSQKPTHAYQRSHWAMVLRGQM